MPYELLHCHIPVSALPAMLRVLHGFSGSVQRGGEQMGFCV
jgi:hypothetical protein